MLSTRQHESALTRPVIRAGRAVVRCGGLTNRMRKESRYQNPSRPRRKRLGEGVTRQHARTVATVRQGRLVAGRHWTSRGKLRGFCQGKTRRKPYVPKRLTFMAPLPVTVTNPQDLGGFLIPENAGDPRCDGSATGCAYQAF